ncbi:hypothetical protein MMC22_010174 [Lobaria immixta]|nr:hypothetical protein [Lobaria immixta]
MSSLVLQPRRLTSKVIAGTGMHRGKPTPTQLLKLVASIQNGDIQCQILGTYQALLDYVYEIVLAFPLFNLIPHMLKNPYREYILLWICSTGTTSRNAPIATSSDKPARLDSSSDRQIILKTSKTSLPARCSGAAISDSPLGPKEDTVSTGIEFQNCSLPSETLKFVFLVDRRGSWVQVECSKIPSDNCFFKELRQIEKDRRFGERGLITFVLQSVNWFVLHVDQINYVKSAIHNTVINLSKSLEILESPGIPPEAQRGIYLPCGRDFDIWPPIGPHALAHFYNHPDDAGDGSFLLDRIPVNLNDPIVHKDQHWPGKSITGWGLQIEYKLRYKVVLITISPGWAWTSLLLEKLLFHRHSFPTWGACFVAIPLSALTVTFLYRSRRALCQWPGLLLANSLAQFRTSAWTQDTWSCEACGETLRGPSSNVSGTASLDQPIQPLLQPSSDPTEYPSSSSAAGSALPGSLSLPPPISYSAGNGSAYRGTYDEEKNYPSCRTSIQEIAQDRQFQSEKLYDKSRILVCATTGSNHLPHCHEKVITDDLNDQQFFQYLRTLHRPKKDIFKPWAWLIGVVAINYVAFEVLPNGEISLLRRPGYAPAPRHQEYHPCEERHDLSGFTSLSGCFHPFPSEVLLQKYHNPASAGDNRYYISRLTKKLNGPLTRDERDRTAYGIELEEGILWRRVFGFAGLGFAFWITFGVIWSWISKDVSAGFTIASCMMIVVVFLLTTATQSFERLQPVYPWRSG